MSNTELHYQAIQAAECMLETFWDSNIYPVDSVLISRRYGYEVYWEKNLENGYKYIASKQGVKGRPSMVVDSSRGSTHSRMYTAECLGSIIYNNSDVVNYYANSDHPVEMEETYERMFAKNLLIPQFALKKTVQAGMRFQDIATFFSVTDIMLQQQLRDCGLKPIDIFH